MRGTESEKEQIDQARIEGLEKALETLEARGGLEEAKIVLGRELTRLKHGYDQDRLTSQDVDDVTSSAFDGCLTRSWCSRADVVGEWPEGANYASEALTRGGKVMLRDFVGEREVVIDGDAMCRGIVLRAAQRGLSVRRWVEEHDAVEADCALQFAAFGEIVYG